MGVKNYEIPETAPEAMPGYDRLRMFLPDMIHDLRWAVGKQAFEVLYPPVPEDTRTPNQVRLEVAQWNEYFAATADQMLNNAPEFAWRSRHDAEKWAGAHATVLKLVQNLFTDPLFRQQFEYREVEDTEERDGDIRALLDQIIIDPRLVTDHMLEVFGLDHLKPHEIDDRAWIYKHEQIEMRAAAIDAVREFLVDGLEPLKADGGSRLRVFRITKGKNRGKVVVSRRIRGGEFCTLELTELHKIGRRVGHIKVNYTEDDIKVLGEIRRMIDSVSRQITDDWDACKPRVAELGQQVAGALGQLSEHVTNHDKKTIRERLERCLTMRDKTGKFNPYSRIAILDSVKWFITSRLESVSRISGYTAGDEMLALSHMQDDLAQAQVASEIKFPKWYEDSVEKRGRQPGVGRPLPPDRVPDAIASLEQTKRVFRGFRFQPYLAVAEKAVIEIDSILARLRPGLESDEVAALTRGGFDLEGDFDDMRRAYIRVFALAKLIEVERRVVNVRNKFFTPGQDLRNVYPNQVRRDIVSIFGVLNYDRIAPEVKVRDYYDAYVSVYTLVREMNELAKHACKQIPEEERVETLRQIDTLLKNFSVAEILESAEGRGA